MANAIAIAIAIAFVPHSRRDELRSCTQELDTHRTSDILTVAEVATELRCSKAHVYNAIKGKVAGVSKLPVISMGRRKLIRRSTLEAWKKNNEGEKHSAIIEAPEVNAVGRMGGKHA